MKLISLLLGTSISAGLLSSMRTEIQQTLVKDAEQHGVHHHDIPVGQTAHYSVREQSAELCDAGSRQWTGSVNVTGNKSIFFWYFESRDSPANDPLVLWMSGGPGATGELGLFLDCGPCAVNEDGNSTRRLEYAWNDHANVIFVDQPSGVGFSDISDRDDIPVDLHEAGQDIYTLLKTFSTDIFPEFANRPLHITGESMGGHYVTGYTHYIASRQLEDAQLGRVAEPVLNITSAVIVDGLIDGPYAAAGYYDFFCEDWRRDGRDSPLMNATACEEMANAVPSCELAGAQCRQTYDKDICAWAFYHCEETIGHYFHANVKPGGWNPYDSRLECTEPPLCSGFASGPTLKYLNQPWVQDRLGVPGQDFKLIDFDTNVRWDAAKMVYVPVTRELTWLLDNTDIRVLVFNGNNDIIMNTPGQNRLLNELPWHQQARYRAQPFQNWYFNDGQLASSDNGESSGSSTKLGGQAKSGGGLSFFIVDEAGHFSPKDQPEAISAVLRSWWKEGFH